MGLASWNVAPADDDDYSREEDFTIEPDLKISANGLRYEHVAHFEAQKLKRITVVEPFTNVS